MLLLSPDHPRRAEAEACARDAYAKAYGARLERFAPLLAALVDGDRAIIAVAGLRTAETAFFSECYLPAPVEQVLAPHAGHPVDRSGIVEFTGLAGQRTGAVLPLISGLRAFALDHGFDWAFFTATAALRRLLAARRLPLLDLASADPARLPDAGRWGSYYTTTPRVCAIARGHVGQSAGGGSSRQANAA